VKNVLVRLLQIKCAVFERVRDFLVAGYARFSMFPLGSKGLRDDNAEQKGEGNRMDEHE
jgi:hypothetical protein